MSTFLIEQGYGVKEDDSVKPQAEHNISELLFLSSLFHEMFHSILCFSSPFIRILPSDSLLTASFENFKRLSGGKNENSDARPPEPLTQGVGDTFTAVVTHLQSPSEILCQKLENTSEFSASQFKTQFYLNVITTWH